MNGCLLDDAFPTMDNGSGGSSAPSPGCQQSYSSKEARKEERRKAKKCRGPPMAFLDVKDPDRQHLNKLPDVPPMNSATGLREHVPVDAPVGYEAFQGGPNRSPGDECNSDRMCQQQAQTEILLFISSGVFVLFLMDLLVKKGGRLF